MIHDWGDLAEGVEFGEQTSHRLALCNMDWDRVNAQDIYGQSAVSTIIVWSMVVMVTQCLSTHSSQVEGVC